LNPEPKIWVTLSKKIRGAKPSGFAILMRCLRGLSESDLTEWLMQNKEELSVLPPDEDQRMEAKARSREMNKFMLRFAEGLRVLNLKQKTLVMMYVNAEKYNKISNQTHRYTCSFLIGSAGIIARGSIRTSARSPLSPVTFISKNGGVAVLTQEQFQLLPKGEFRDYGKATGIHGE
jgi:hypothetical protein